ncbi:class F sortase [Rhodococcoides kroppenstedtii]|uniref:class F sortase n=1 Tax=Rhodococcoides kroppenstedtii TaxID=293050 RepID=UPI003628B4CD
MIRPAGATLAALAFVALVGCGTSESTGPVAPPDRSPVASQLTAAPPSEPAPPTYLELRGADGATYLSTSLHPDPVVRDADAVLNPVDDRPAWWGESGLPGSAETVVVAGHNYSQSEAPFRALRVVQAGDLALLATPAGTHTYRVESVGPVAKGALLSDNALRAQVPGRLVLANCDVRDGRPTDDNYLVVAQAVVD